MKMKYLVLLVSVSVAAMVACGGGGGASSNPPANYPTLTSSAYANAAAGEFVTLAPYAILPSDATCAALVRAVSKAEIRPSKI